MVRTILRYCWVEPVGAISRWRRNDGPSHSAAVAYYASLSFFPVMWILVSSLGLFLKYSSLGANARREVLDAVAEQASPALSDDVAVLLDEVGKNASLGGFLGVGILLVTATLLFSQFDRALDRIWNIAPRDHVSFFASIRSIFVGRLRAFAMLAVVGVLILTLFLAGLAISAIDRYTVDLAPWAAGVLRLLNGGMTIFANAALFSAIYKWIPRAKVRDWCAIRGGVATALVWEIGRRLLTAFVIGGRYTSTYGVIGAFMAMMVWTYYATAIVFLGGEYVRFISESDDSTTPGK